MHDVERQQVAWSDQEVAGHIYATRSLPCMDPYPSSGGSCDRMSFTGAFTRLRRHRLWMLNPPADTDTTPENTQRAQFEVEFEFSLASSTLTHADLQGLGLTLQERPDLTDVCLVYSGGDVLVHVGLPGNARGRKGAACQNTAAVLMKTRSEA